METLYDMQRINLHGLHCKAHGVGFLVGINCSNGEIFDKLKIKDRYAFIESIVGYKPRAGNFPVVNGLKDLTKVVEALINYNNNPDIIEMETMEGYNF